MGTRLERELSAAMAPWEAAGLRRRLVSPDAETRADFVSNDYLGLARDPRVVEAGREALARYGAGGRASRLLGGGTPLEERVERAVADWLGAQAALLFTSGYQANLGLIPSLVAAGDVVLSDERNHASLIDACRLARAAVRVFAHGDLEHLERELGRAAGARRRLVVTEGVFSMDGDAAPLAAMAGLCARHRAELVVDEAHAAGLLGSRERPGAGAFEAARAAGAPEEVLAARVVTGGKALGVAGAFVVGGTVLREHLVNRARTLLFTTAVPPAVSGALVASVELARGAHEAREAALAAARGLSAALGLPQPAAAIVPFVVGSSRAATELATTLRRDGFDVGAVRPPTVPEGASRLRLVCHAGNTADEIERLAGRLRARRSLPSVRVSAPSGASARALFVVGTDTGVGKTVASALCARALAAAPGAGTVVYWKPVQTGEESDSTEVGRLVAGTAVQVSEPGYAFPLPASPHEAAAAAEAAVDLARLDALLAERLDRAGAGGVVVVELAGGLLVPLDGTRTQADWITRHAGERVLVARSGLGTLNHTLLTVEALERRRLAPCALLLVGERHPSNHATLRARSGIASVFELPPLEPLEPRTLDAWVSAHDIVPALGVRAG